MTIFPSFFRYPSGQAGLLRFVATAAAAMAVSHAVWGANADLEGAKDACARMKVRQVEIGALLKDQKAGERNDGLLEPNGEPAPETTKLIDDENLDRRAAYDGISSATGVSSSEVGQRRAENIRNRLIPGVRRMVPTVAGEWEWSIGGADDQIPPRLLTRPGASLRSAPDGDISISGLANFTMYDVVDHAKGAGGDLWYQVSERGGAPSGWILEAEALEWHQSLVMAYETQNNRNRVLFFNEKEELRDLAEMQESDRSKEVARLIEVVEAGGDPGRSVVAMEPIFDQRTQEIPVIIPILDHETLTIDGTRETRLLRLAAATRSEQDMEVAPVRLPLIDIVFVMDATSSMGPYLEETKRAVAEFAAGVGGSDPTIRFGVVAYRDSDPQFSSRMEYTVKNFTPNLVSAVELVEALVEVKALASDPGDPIPEDVNTGIAQAIRSSWRSDRPGEELRFIILVGDASGNEPYRSNGSRNLGNESELGSQNVRDLLDQEGISLQAIHIKAPDYKSDHAKAEADFSAVSRNPGDSIGSRYLAVDYRPESFKADIETPFRLMGEFLTTAKEDFVEDAGQADQAIQKGLAQPSMKQMFGGLLANAYVQWVAGQNRVPLDRDFKGWVIPNDLADPSRNAMEVNVLLKRPELENLKRRLDGVLQATNGSPQAGGDFFDRIQEIPGNAIKDPGASEFSTAFDFPAFIANLPYRSRILDMKRGQWEAMSAGNKTQYINDWRNMSAYYGDLLQDQGFWKKLSPEGEDFVMIPLTSLP